MTPFLSGPLSVEALTQFKALEPLDNTARDTLQRIQSLDVTTFNEATAYRAIRTEVTRLVCETKQLPVLVIDEAHHLRNDVLEDLRLLCLCRTPGYAARRLGAGA